MKIIIIMGSDKDTPHAERITTFLEKFNITPHMRIASAHKTPLKVLKILEENPEAVFITIAGKSNALSAFIDAQTINPVIATPPLKSDKFDTDLFSSLSMPSGVAPLTVLNPENAGLAALKILALNDENLRTKISDYQQSFKDKIEKKDKEVSNG